MTDDQRSGPDRPTFLAQLLRVRAAHVGELRHAVRLTVAAVIAYAVGETVRLPQAYWAVFTAVLVSQASVGGSVKAAFDWLVGTLGGGAYAALVSTLVPNSDPLTKGAALGAALLPLAFLAAVRPTFRFAPVTGVIIILIAPVTQLSPLDAAINRLVEICVGGFIGIAVSLFVLPARASQTLNRTAARTLEALAAILPLIAEFGRMSTPAGDHIAFEREYTAAHDRALDIIFKLELAVDEARRERSSFLSGAPDPEPILRTLRRLRNDIIMLGRAAAEPFPDAYHGRLAAALGAALEALRVYFLALGRCLETRAAPPTLAPIAAAITRYGDEVDHVRGEGLTRGLAGDVVGRTFAVGFALEQLKANLSDLSGRTAERARVRAESAPAR